jgi:tellurite resistance protein TerC
MSVPHLIAWGIFLLIVLTMLALDLFVLHRKPHTIQMREALLGAAIPVVAALLFAVGVYVAYDRHLLDLGTPIAVSKGHEALYPTTGGDATLLFLTGYLVELSLSADNVFLFVILLSFFKVPRELQHRVLFWGVLGALVMRGIMIVAGAAILEHFEWVIYLFGAILIFTGIRMMFVSGEMKDPGNNVLVRLVKRILPFTEGYHGKRFFIRERSATGSLRTVGTTLFLVLLCIEFTDLVFALDSIPAIFGITRDPFLVFTSNVFAILGLRSMYFLLAGVMDKFHYLRYGLAFVLAFVGVKMVLPVASWAATRITGHPVEWGLDHYRFASLGVILGALGISIVASLLVPSKTHHANPLADNSNASA